MMGDLAECPAIIYILRFIYWEPKLMLCGIYRVRRVLSYLMAERLLWRNSWE